MDCAKITIVSPTDDRWRQLIRGDLMPKYECLALRILMIRLRSDYQQDEASIDDLAAELHQFFTKNIRFAAADYQAIFHGERACTP